MISVIFLEDTHSGVVSTSQRHKYLGYESPPVHHGMHNAVSFHEHVLDGPVKKPLWLVKIRILTFLALPMSHILSDGMYHIR